MIWIRKILAFFSYLITEIIEFETIRNLEFTEVISWSRQCFTIGV